MSTLSCPELAILITSDINKGNSTSQILAHQLKILTMGTGSGRGRQRGRVTLVVIARVPNLSLNVLAKIVANIKMLERRS